MKVILKSRIMRDNTTETLIRIPGSSQLYLAFTFLFVINPIFILPHLYLQSRVLKIIILHYDVDVLWCTAPGCVQEREHTLGPYSRI